MSALLRCLLVWSLVLCPLVASAQTFTWTQLTHLDPDSGRVGIFRGVASNGTLILQGLFRTYRRAPDGTLTAITCPNLTHPANQVQLSPTILGLADNAGLTVAGTDEIEVAPGVVRTVGILQDAGGTCEVVTVPGAVATRLKAVSSTRASAGESQGPNVALGLRRFEGFERAPDGTLTTLKGVCDTDPDGVVSDDTMTPDAMAPGWLTFHAKCRLQPNNRYTYAGGACEDGGDCFLLTDPTHKSLWIPAVTEDGIAYGITAGDAGVIGGASWVIDLRTRTMTPFPLPPPTTVGGTVKSFAPMAATATRVIGWASERKANCPDPTLTVVQDCTVTSQWLGTLQTPPEERGKKPKKDKPDQKERKEDRR